MSHTLGVRQAQKQRTRQALMDAALDLLAHQSLSSLGLRQVTREVGIAPAAFYRHFRDIDELGVALVEETFGSLHAMVRDIRAEQDDTETVIHRTVDVIARYVRRHRGHFRFVTRERHGPVAPVREAIAAQLRQFADDLARDLGGMLEDEGWSAEDIRMLADLYVDHMVMTASAFLDVPPGQPEQERRIAETAERQLRLISVGRRHWHDA